MSLTLGLLIIFMLLVGALVIFNDWRATLPLMLGADLSRIGLLVSTGFLATGTSQSILWVVELITAFSTSAILLVTALTFTREYNTEHLDEFALMELRRAADRSQQRAQGTSQWTGWIVPAGAVLLAAFATLLLGRTYPVTREPMLDAVWMFGLLCGLLVLITANDVLKLGLGLLLMALSAKVLYFGLAPRANVLHIGLLELLTLILTVLAAYLSGLLYGRLRSLDIGSVFERR